MTHVLQSVQNAWGWLFLSDYEAAKEQATEIVLTRYARRNTNFQNGAVLDKDDLEKLSAGGDYAMEGLKRRKPTG